MATFDLQRLTAPVSPDDPCGPDLDLAGDSEYMNFVAGAEGRLPSSYFDGKDESGALGRLFQFNKTELDAVFAAATPLLAKTRDLRLLLLLAKFSLLGRQLEDFTTLVQAVAALLGERWGEVHPRAEGGEFQARMVAVESIDVQPTVIMPLQFLPLIEHRRFGTVSFRSYLIATGAIAPRENEDVVDLAAVDKLIREVDLPVLIARRTDFTTLQTALASIYRSWSEKDSSGAFVQIDKITELVGKIVTFLDDAVKLRDPAAALVPAGGANDGSAEAGTGDGAAADGATGPVGRVTNQPEAAAALTAVAGYLSQNEPSSPTLLLVRQANQLLGKSFIEILRTLVPTHFEQAAVDIGRTESFSLPIERLAQLTGEGGGSGEVGEGDGASSDAPAEGAEGDGASSDAPAIADAPAEGAEGDGASSDAAAIAALEGPQFEIQTRNQALATLDQVSAYFRAAEPSSPIPFLIDRARDLAQRDFLSVLKALLPPDTLKGADTLKANGSSS